MSNVSFRTKKDKVDLLKQKVTISSDTFAKTKFLFGICDCTVASDVGTGDRTCLRAWTGQLHTTIHTITHKTVNMTTNSHRYKYITKSQPRI